MLHRRRFLVSGCSALLAGTRAASAGPSLTLWGPAAVPSVIVAQAIGSGLLKGLGIPVSFRAWRTQDDLQAGLSSGGMQAAIVPVHVVANFYNRGVDVRLLNVMTRGLLYVIAGDKYRRFSDLAGKTLIVPFHNNMPDYVLRSLLRKAGLQIGKDIDLQYVGSSLEAAQLLLSGRGDAALLDEPAISTALMRSRSGTRRLVRAIDCRAEWERLIGGTGILPLAGMALTQRLVNDIGPAGVATLQKALQTAAGYVSAHPAAISLKSFAQLDMLSPVLVDAVTHSNLCALKASTVRPDLERFLSVLAAEDARIIGGKVPDSGFYVL